MQLDTLRAELERHFDLEELVAVCRDLLGFDPEQVGGTAARGSFVRALVDHAVEQDAVEALCDVLVASRPNVDPKVAALRVDGANYDEDLRAGEVFGPFTIVRKLGDGRLGFSYVARRDGREWRVKVLRREATRDRRGLQRFLTVSRLVGAISHRGLPSSLTTGRQDIRWYVAHEYVEGQTLAARVARTGPLHINEAKPLLRSVLEALSTIHQRRLAHGDLRLENLLTFRTPEGGQQVMLLDAGSDRLRARPRLAQSAQELFSTVGCIRTVAPETIRGQPADPLSDVYSFGAVMYELLSGKPLFHEAVVATEVASAHLSRAPQPPSAVAPKGWVTKDADDFVLSLLAKQADQRPTGAEALLEALDSLGRSTERRAASPAAPADLDARIDALVADPENEDAAVQLESAADQGADPVRVGEAFLMAAESIEVGESADKREAKKSLLYRAARIWEHAARDAARAEEAYLAILELDPKDDIAATALEDTRRALGKYEEVVEMLLARRENATSGAERARALAEIGRLYQAELKDTEQALVALTQAFCEEPRETQYADEVERIAGSSAKAWAEVLQTCAAVLAEDALPTEQKNALLARVGRWYAEKVQRPDLALPCFQAILTTEPAYEPALEGMTQIYRKAQQWVELATVLSRRADAAPPARSRDLRTEVAELLEIQLNDAGRARDLYEQVLAEDPGHVRASEALARIYERTADYASLAKLLERKAQALRGDEQKRALCRIAELLEDRLRDDAGAIRTFQKVLADDPTWLDALRGLDRLFGKAGRYAELLDVLRRQVQLAATPRQKIGLWERIAGIYDEEFLDHEKAAEAWEQILAIDGAHEGALTSLVRHYRALDRWEDVASLYERHLKLVTEGSRRIELLLALGRVLTEQIGSPDRATRAYERVLEVDPAHAPALEALARLRETAGDADAALAAIEALAEKAETGAARAEQWLRAARLLEGRGDRDGAIERYKRALDASPGDAGAAQSLRAAYVARGDVNAALQLIEREIDQAEGDRSKARLASEAALLARDRLKDDRRAEEYARRAVAFDPTALTALGVLGDLAFEAGRHLEASRHYEQLADGAGSLPKEQAVRVLIRYVDALAALGSTEKALTAMDTLLRIAPDDTGALLRVAQVTFEAGQYRRAVDLYADLLGRSDELLSTRDRAVAQYRYGEALRQIGRLDEARRALEESIDLDASAPDPLRSLAALFEQQERWEEALRTKGLHLDLATGDERVQLLMEIGDLAAGKLGDRTRAAKSLVAALEERPDDRKLLTKLMQLYSEEKDWVKLIEVVLKLADLVTEDRQKSKYVYTAAGIAARQLTDAEKALELYRRVLTLDPQNDKALDEAIDLARDHGRYEEARALLERKLEAASGANDRPRMLVSFQALGELYEKHLGDIEKAIDAYEAAQSLEPDDRARAEHLAGLYASDPHRHLDKAIAAQLALLRHNPHRAEAYKLMRRLYTEVKRADAAWCLCQALYVLNLAEPDEERFYKRMRADTAAPAQAAVGEDEWLNLLMHPDADPLLTAIFALIEPVVILSRSQPLETLGYDPRYALDLARHPYPMSQTLHYACGVLGMVAPVTFENPNDPGGLSFLHAHTPSVVLGVAALSAEVPPQAAAFIAARHLTYFRPGMYVRHLVPTGTGLKAWLFAAIKLIVPQFPIAPDLEGPVLDAQRALEQGLPAQSKDQLARIVSRLLQAGGALDLKRWVGAIDLTADRAGFVIAHDLETAVEIVRASDEASSAVPSPERLKELVLYAVSPQYVELRQRLGITIDA